MRVLIVDDFKDYREIHASRFREAGAAQIDCTKNIEEALILLQDNAYDVIMLDKGIPFREPRQHLRDFIYDPSEKLEDTIRCGFWLVERIRSAGKSQRQGIAINPENQKSVIAVMAGMRLLEGEEPQGIDFLLTKGFEEPEDYQRILEAAKKKTTPAPSPAP